MRGLLVAAVVVGLAPASLAFGEPVKPAKNAGREWKAKRATKPLPPPTITLAVLSVSPDADARQTKLLQKQGISAYQAGHYDSAVRKFAAAMSNHPTPELIFHAAQAYRLKGDRAKAIELYTEYLEIAPHGAAANACRAELEKLLDVP